MRLNVKVVRIKGKRMTDFWHTNIEAWHVVIYLMVVWGISAAIKIGKKLGKKDWQTYEELKKRYEK